MTSVFIIITNDGDSGNFVEPKAYQTEGAAIFAGATLADAIAKQTNSAFTRCEHTKSSVYPAEWNSKKGGSVCVKRLTVVVPS